MYCVKALIPVAPMVLLLFAAAGAHAEQFSFDPATGQPQARLDLTMPAALIGVIAAAGAFLIIHERKKAKGIWFSNSEPLK